MFTRLLALALFLITPMGNAFADCSDTYSLPDSQWHQISLPCAPPADSNTVQAILGDDMGSTATYGTHWQLYSYNSGTNAYIDVGANGQMIPGVGYWIYHITGSSRTLSMPAGSVPMAAVQSAECPSATSGCVEIPLHYSTDRAGEMQFNLIGIPNSGSLLWGDIRVAANNICNAANGSPTGCTQGDAQNNNIFQNMAWQYDGTDYNMLDNDSPLSSWSAMWVRLLPDAQPDSELRLLLAANSPDIATTAHRITAGTDRSTEMDTSSNTVAEQAHGTRVYCPVSHYSYDDPVVHPGQPSAAHLHMFWGNTQADAFSTVDSLLSSGNASCEGGVNNKSSYWAPALFNENDEVTLPESIFVYYKSFSHTPGFDRNTIMPIPDGLQMLTNQDVPNSGPWNFRTTPDMLNGREILHFSIAFPMCLQVGVDGSPVLSSSDNVSHLSYSVSSRETPSDCPASHPYRIPQLIYNITYDVLFTSQWYLASDHNAAVQGSSLHADYMAAWDRDTMDSIVLCNRESKASCEFNGAVDGQLQFRNQLPERFLSPDGQSVYASSVALLPGTDRTPFGTSLGKSAAGADH